MIRIILAEDHQIVRNGIKLLLSDDPELQVVLEASNGQQVLDALEKGLQADIILSDVTMPVMDGMALLKSAQELYPDLKIVFLSMLTDTSMIAEAIYEGARGYLFKNCDAMELIFAIKFAHAGSTYLGSELSLTLLQQSALIPQKSLSSIILTERELEIVHLIADGLTNTEIGSRLFISKRTVEGHRQELLKKTNSKNSASMIRVLMLTQVI
ncbi:MAG: response regulator transcription factor [Pedobacter sp.]|nr:MAG: response regulator transcription factor [Pedobacter sp.]